MDNSFLSSIYAFVLTEDKYEFQIRKHQKHPSGQDIQINIISAGENYNDTKPYFLSKEESGDFISVLRNFVINGISCGMKTEEGNVIITFSKELEYVSISFKSNSHNQNIILKEKQAYLIADCLEQFKRSL